MADNQLIEMEAKSGLMSNGEVTDGGTKPTEAVSLQRQVGIVGSIAMLVGTIIGSGIFSSPSSVMNNVTSTGATLIVWVICGAFAMVSALSYCELGSMYSNNSGGEYYYLKQAFGPIPAFLFSFTAVLLIKPASLSIISLVCGQYILVACNKGEDVVWISKLIAVGVIIIIMVINCLSVKGATTTQVLFTAAKLISVVMVIVTGLVRLGQGHNENFRNSFVNTTTSVTKFGYAMYQGLWAYDGWNTLNFVSEEMKNPLRDLPLSIMVGIPFITGCYLVMNVAYLTVMTTTQLAQSSAVAVDLANKLYGVMAWVIPLLVSCSTFGAANGTVFTSGRLIYVAAKNGHLPKVLAMIHRTKSTPLPATLFTCVLAMLMLIPESSSFESLVNYFSFASWMFYGATFLSLLVLRYRKPDLKRPYKVFIVIPILAFLFSIGLVVAPFCDSPLESTYCLIFIISGLIFYFAFVHYQVLPPSVMKAYDRLSQNISTWANLALPEIEDEEDKEGKDMDDTSSVDKAVA